VKKWKVEYKGILELSIQSMIYLQGHRVPKFHHRDLYLKRIANTSRRGPQPCERDDRVKDSNLAGGLRCHKPGRAIWEKRHVECY
jgi:hypothetical protein